jgi:hypothetical protein
VGNKAIGMRFLKHAKKILKHARKRSRVPTKPGPSKSAQIFSDDVWLVSYPKSGNTWGRFLIGTLMNPLEPITFDNVEQRIPDLYRNTNEELRRIARPRLIKSHEPNFGEYPKTIYFVRDPRAVFVSYYFFMKRTKIIPDERPMEAMLYSFISGEIGFGRWDEHVQGWIRARNVLIVRYEDMIFDIRHEAHRMLEFLHLHVNEETLAQAIERSSADQMRKLELNSPSFSSGQRRDIPFVRKAAADSWQTELDAGLANVIQGSFAATMQQVGY